MSTLPEPDEYADDLAWHALNYRTAATQHAQLMWVELEACVARKLAAAAAEIERLQADAGRYRWLRGNMGEITTSAWVDMRFYGKLGCEQDGARLDAAIDAAIVASQAEKRGP